MATKKEIRKNYLLKRNLLPLETRMRMNEAIHRRLFAHPLFQQANTIFIYVSYHTEVDTWTIIRDALSFGKRVAVPKVHKDTMDFYYIDSLDELTLGTNGICEPSGEESKLATDVDGLVIMPLIAFDSHCNRIGYGGGYYDKYLCANPGHPTMGIAFSIQETCDIPSDSFDLKPDCILTEEKEVQV